MQPQVEGLENDLMETMSHIKLELSFPFKKKKKGKRKTEWGQVLGPKLMATLCSNFQKDSAQRMKRLWHRF